MLYSQLKKWHWLISWDNPQPATSSTMLADLASLGKVTRVQTATTVILAPYASAGWRKIRAAIVANLNPATGKAVYINLRSGNAFDYGPATGHLWNKVN